MFRRWLSALLLTTAACSGQVLDRPEALGLDTFAANKEFSLPLVMRRCSDPCATYEAAECGVLVTDQTIIVEVEVPYERTADVCIEICGPQVLAHCPVPALPAGTYQVSAGGFQDTITVQ